MQQQECADTDATADCEQRMRNEETRADGHVCVKHRCAEATRTSIDRIREGERIENDQSRGPRSKHGNQRNELAVVLFPDAGLQKVAVMIKALAALIAGVAVHRSRSIRNVDVAPQTQAVASFGVGNADISVHVHAEQPHV